IVENSFDGTVLNESGVNESGAFLSRKTSEAMPPMEGIGILSVRTVCAKYGGLAEFAATGGVWKASALVDMEGGLSGGVE
ncbi:MAG: GHKL domain-containing protein, partial [Synergistaceae bacterium]|nr:GHKL domain-containing protein [Synergistaceae bacterium]